MLRSFARGSNGSDLYQDYVMLLSQVHLLYKKKAHLKNALFNKKMAEQTGLEPATLGVLELHYF